MPQSLITITEEELTGLYSEQNKMRDEINTLASLLANYEKKWSKIVKNVIRENADLKSQNSKLKKKMNSENVILEKRTSMGSTMTSTMTYNA